MIHQKHKKFNYEPLNSLNLSSNSSLCECQKSPLGNIYKQQRRFDSHSLKNKNSYDTYTRIKNQQKGYFGKLKKKEKKEREENYSSQTYKL